MAFRTAQKIEATRFESKTEMVFDVDSPEGREALKEFSPHYTSDGSSPATPLDYTTWLAFAAETYKISPRIEDYLITVNPICPADLPNRNGIGFPLRELRTFAPPPSNRMVYKCWAGCPMHLEHDNEVHERAYGVVLDSALHRIKNYGGNALWKVMGLSAVDKVKHPDIADELAQGKINTFSMGALADYFTCSFCGTRVEENKRCGHLRGGDCVEFNECRDIYGNIHIAYQNAHVLQPIELSIVRDPAWVIALSDHILVK